MKKKEEKVRRGKRRIYSPTPSTDHVIAESFSQQRTVQASKAAGGWVRFKGCASDEKRMRK